MKARLLEAIARAAHECNRCHSFALGLTHLGGSWEQQTTAHKQIALEAVRRVMEEGFTVREVHEAWVSDMAREGWRHGERDPMGKTDPRMASWDSLPPVEQGRVHLFASVCRAMYVAMPVSVLR